MRRLLLAGLLLAALVGCTPSGEQSQAGATANDFATALQNRDGAAACGLLIAAARESLESDSGRPCAEAVLAVRAASPGPVRLQVWGDEAEVRVGGDTIFADRTRAGWRIRAAGCSRQGDGRPYECEVAP